MQKKDHRITDGLYKKMERVKGIEPSYRAWKAGALPLSYTRMWSEQQDLNLRPLGPKPSALPNCAMPRQRRLV